MKKTRVVIYTDGGTTPNPGLGGWAAVLVSPAHDGATRELYDSEPNTTNNRMELTAAIRALRALKYSCAVDLYTDSAYMGNAFTKGWLTKWRNNGWLTSNKEPVLNKDLWEELFDLSQKHDIEWHWIKGHASDDYNNLCDALVQKAKDEYRKNGTSERKKT